MDPEPPAGSDESDSPSGGLSGFMGFMGSTPRVIGAITALIGALSGLLIALNKAGFSAMLAARALRRPRAM
jgi:uncharacterized membrane protein